MRAWLVVGVVCAGCGGADAAPPHVAALDGATEEGASGASTVDVAIARYEAFVAAHPDDARTPDALHRLGEVHYQRARAAYEDAMVAWGEDESGDGPPTPAFGEAITRWEDLLARFPGYRHATAVRYALGIAYEEMDRFEDACRVWLEAVCVEGPSSTADPYDGCTAAPDPRGLVPEMWYRIGDAHFDGMVTPSDFARTAAAYRRAAAAPDHRIHPVALYKLAWALYRADQYDDALARFGELLTWHEHGREGPDDLDLREEAREYAALILARAPDGDDPTRPVDRVRALLAESHPWGLDVAIRTGVMLFAEVREAEAIDVWTLARDAAPDTTRRDLDARIRRARERAVP